MDGVDHPASKRASSSPGRQRRQKLQPPGPQLAPPRLPACLTCHGTVLERAALEPELGQPSLEDYVAFKLIAITATAPAEPKLAVDWHCCCKCRYEALTLSPLLPPLLPPLSPLLPPGHRFSPGQGIVSAQRHRFSPGRAAAAAAAFVTALAVPCRRRRFGRCPSDAPCTPYLTAVCGCRKPAQRLHHSPDSGALSPILNPFFTVS